MTFGPIGNTAGLSGSQNDAANQVRRTQADQKAQRAEGLGATDSDAETSDRDADGRRLWELAQQSSDEDAAHQEAAQDEPGETGAARQSKDAAGESGGLLDLTG